MAELVGVAAAPAAIASLLQLVDYGMKDCRDSVRHCSKRGGGTART